MMRILSLGAGVQSSTLALMSARGDFPRVDFAVFADTGWESQRVYEWLNWLEGQLTFPVYRVKREGPDLGDLWLDVVNGRRSLNGSPLPGHFMSPSGMRPFHCSKEFKTRVIQKKMREMLGLSAGQRGPKGVAIESWLGISYDEMFRMKDSELRYVKNRFPLVDLRMRRGDCLRWMAERQYPTPPRSSCIFCPFRSDKEWHDLKEECPDDFDRAVAFDKAIRDGFPGMVGNAFLHRSLRPLGDIDFTPHPSIFDAMEWGTKQDCEGACGV